jgi:hypothetical protein
MALSDLDTFLVKINPLGGRKTAVLEDFLLFVIFFKFISHI